MDIIHYRYNEKSTYHWNNAGFDEVDDSMINALDPEMVAMDWRHLIENNLMPDPKSISYAKVLRDYYFDDDEEDDIKDGHDQDIKTDPDEDEGKDYIGYQRSYFR